MQDSGASLVEMPAHGRQSFCCGAGGAQMWKEEEHGDIAVNLARFQQAQQTGADTLAVSCPFCLSMMVDAGKDLESSVAVKDIAEVIWESLK